MNVVRLRTILAYVSVSIGVATVINEVFDVRSGRALLINKVWAATSADVHVRSSRCYKVDERGPEHLEQSPYTLCLTSADLNIFKKSVVTVTLSKEGDKGARPSVLAKRHYILTDKDAYGRRVGPERKKRSLLVFDHDQSIVEIGFIAKETKKFYFKAIGSSKDQAPPKRQKLQLGRLDRP